LLSNGDIFIIQKYLFFFFKAILILIISELGTTLLLIRLPVTTNFFPISLILVTLMMEAIRSSETSALTRAKQLHIPEEGILQLLARFELMKTANIKTAIYKGMRHRIIWWRGEFPLCHNRRSECSRQFVFHGSCFELLQGLLCEYWCN
jgi:hypothetical protein